MANRKYPNSWQANKARKEYYNAFRARTYVGFSIRLRKDTEADVIEHLKGQENVKDYLLSLVRKDMGK